MDDETLLAATDQEAGERFPGQGIDAPVDTDSQSGADAGPGVPARGPSVRIPRLPSLPALPALVVPRRRPARAEGDLGESDLGSGPTTADGESDDAAYAPSSGTETAGAAKPGEVLAGWVSRAIDAYPRPVLPLATQWDASVAGLVRQVPHLPRLATKPLELLDRFGAVHVGPEAVGFDGDEIAWDRVVEVRTAPAWSSLSADALEANFAQYLRVIPRLPGRGWVLGKISELLVSLYLAAVPLPDDVALLSPDGAQDGGTDGGAEGAQDGPSADVVLVGSEDDGVLDDAAPGRKRVPFAERTVTEIVFRKRFGEGEQQASTTSVLLQLAFPEATQAVLALAAERDVPVVHVPVEDGEMGAAIRRAAAWRGTALGLRDRFAR